MREFGSPLEDMLAPMSYCDVQQAFDADFPFGLINYWKSSNLAQLSDDAIDTMVAFMKRAPSLQPMVIIDQFGGAVARVPDDATAFGHRDAAYDLIIAAIWCETRRAGARRVGEVVLGRDAAVLHRVGVRELPQRRGRRARPRRLRRQHYSAAGGLKRRYDPGTSSRTTRTSARTDDR